MHRLPPRDPWSSLFDYVWLSLVACSAKGTTLAKRTFRAFKYQPRTMARCVSGVAPLVIFVIKSSRQAFTAWYMWRVVTGTILLLPTMGTVCFKAGLVILISDLGKGLIFFQVVTLWSYIVPTVTNTAVCVPTNKWNFVLIRSALRP